MLGVSVPAVLHVLNDWAAGSFQLPLGVDRIQAASLFVFLGYTRSASLTEQQVRRTPQSTRQSFRTA